MSLCVAEHNLVTFCRANIEIWKEYSASFKLLRAKKAEKYGVSTAEGKEPFPTEGFNWVMKRFVDPGYMNKDQMDWVQLAAVLCRNTLMRRMYSAKTAFDQLRWRGDHMRIIYGNDKGDQMGARQTHRSLYSNPTNPK